ncbi:hypothetical protein IPL68_02355 [Candidatus Saccharibacteria bacterium]|nr:MAG: hypothetical protein IPL68_02355 [Candidatus Saccharibacteria bacterium]
MHYRPALSLITGIAWDHPDIYPTQEEYNQAFRDFLAQSDTSVMWQSDIDRLGGLSSPLRHTSEGGNPGIRGEKITVLSDTDENMKLIELAGKSIGAMPGRSQTPSQNCVNCVKDGP